MRSPTTRLRARLDRLQYLALQVGGVGLALCIAGGLIWPHRFSASYLVAFLFWIGITLGCIGLTMLHHLVGGQWGLPIRRPMEAGASTVIPLAVLFLPLALNLPVLYPWARPEEVRLDAELAHKAAYLNVSFFLGRAAFYFVIWAAFAAMLRRWSRAQDEDADPSPSRRLQHLSGPGLVFLFLTSTFAAIDWGMSLEPKWSSTIYGAMLDDGRGPVRPRADDRDRHHAGVRPAHDRRRHPRPAPRPGQPAAGVRHALGLHGLLPVPDHLVGQPRRGDALVHPQDARRLAVGRPGPDRLPLLPAVLRPALPREQAAAATRCSGWLGSSW